MRYNFLKSSIFRLLLALSISSFLVACKKDFYTTMIEQGCTPLQPTISPSCYETLEKTLPINHESFAKHPHAKHKLIEAFHLLLTAPIAFPKDKPMFGLATMEQAQLHDFSDRFLDLQGSKLNRELVNYILNATKEFRYGCLGTASQYTLEAIEVCYDEDVPPPSDSSSLPSSSLASSSSPSNPSPSVSSINLLPMIKRIHYASNLLHEARHSEAGMHQVYLSETRAYPVADVGLDGPWGWQIALAWGFIQGNEQSQPEYFTKDTLREIGTTLKWEFGYIYSLPSSLAPIKQQNEFFTDYITNLPKIEALRYPMVPRISFSSKPLSIPLDGEIHGTSTSNIVTDLDQDGDEDFILLGETEFQILWGSKNRSLTKSTPCPLPTHEPVSLTLVDANHDRYQDLVFFTTTQLFLVVSDPTEACPSAIQIGQPFDSIFSVKAGDVNQDGEADLLILKEDLTLGVMLGSKTSGSFGDFEPKTISPSHALRSESRLKIVEDLNKDGNLDLVFVSPHHLTLGFATKQEEEDIFLLAAEYMPNPSESQSFLGFSLYPIPQSLAPPSMGPLFVSIDGNSVSENGDRIDAQYRLNVFAFDKAYQLRLSSSKQLPFVHAGLMLVDDANQDGTLDVLSISKEVSLSVATNLSNQGFLYDEDILPISTNNLHETAWLADLDGDGYKDLIFLTVSNQAVLFFNEGKKHVSYIW